VLSRGLQVKTGSSLRSERQATVSREPKFASDHTGKLAQGKRLAREKTEMQSVHRCRIENVVHGIENHREARGAGCAMLVGEHFCRVENRSVCEKSPAPNIPTASRNLLNDAGRVCRPVRKLFFSLSVIGRSRTSNQKQATAISPGISVYRNTLWYACPVSCSSQSAVSGPRMAPSVSMKRSRPNARP